MDAREKLLEATRRCLLERGHGGCTVKAIAHQAGVNHGLVHHYFGCKENLIVELVRREGRRVDGELKQARSPQALREFLAGKFLPDDEFTRLMVQLVAMADGMPAVKSTIREIMVQRRRYLGEILGTADSVAATLLTSAVMGLAIQYNLDPTLPAEAVIGKLLETLGPAAAPEQPPVMQPPTGKGR